MLRLLLSVPVCCAPASLVSSLRQREAGMCVHLLCKFRVRLNMSYNILPACISAFCAFVTTCRHCMQIELTGHLNVNLQPHSSTYFNVAQSAPASLRRAAKIPRQAVQGPSQDIRTCWIVFSLSCDFCCDCDAAFCKRKLHKVRA